jgi:nitroreductase
MMNLIARRVSCRAYRPDPVPDAHLRQILEAARRKPLDEIARRL